MIVLTSKDFDKKFTKLPFKIKLKFKERYNIFCEDEFDLVLSNHKLNPPFQEYRSINITGDYRLIYKKIDSETYFFSQIGTHSELYK